jgi:hypothetical protein
MDGGPHLEVLMAQKELICPSVVLALITKKSGLVKDRKKGLSKYKQSFLGSDAVEWIYQYLSLSSADEAYEVCKKLPVRHGKKDCEFKNEPTLFTFLVTH